MKKGMTVGELYGPAMNILGKEEAKKYFKELVNYLMEFGEKKYSYNDAEKIVKSNLGYYAGYCDNETRERVERLFECSHPIFGAICSHIPTPEESFEIGKQISLKVAKDGSYIKKRVSTFDKI